MRQSTLTSGDLVRYQATTARWHLGIVRKVDDHFVEVEFFWGGILKVPLEQARLFRDYLDGRQRVLSLRRTELCKAFFNEPLHRLRKERVRKIKVILRRYGLAFWPKDWPTPDSRVQIKRDDSVVVDDKPAKDPRFEALLPRWLEPLRLPPSSRDPLGFQAHAESLANELLPGLTVFTSRIGYYGFLAWAVQLINSEPCPIGQARLERLHRLERTLALCEFVKHGAGDNSCPLLGQRSKTQILQSADRDRFSVPKRILKNQASAGAYRLYFTSLHSLEFAQDAIDVASEDLLPLSITGLGKKLAYAFNHQLDDKFAAYALNETTQDRDTIRDWGKRLCFSNLGNLKRYREPFLEGFLLGNSSEAEKRYLTVQRLFQRGLLTGDYKWHAEETSNSEVLAEEEVRAAEEMPAVVGLSNDRVLLHFYEELPGSSNRDFQAAAAFELLAVGLATLFQAVVEGLWQSGRIKPVQLAGRLVEEGQCQNLWTSPLKSSAAHPPNARKLLQQVFDEDNTIRRAALGGVLLRRVLHDRTLAAVADDLATNPALMLVDAALRAKPGRSLEEAFPDLIAAMVERHLTVSVNKNRQRWCYMDGDIVVKDDLQEMQVGFHSFRFPQLFSLCRDLKLQGEDLRNGL